MSRYIRTFFGLIVLSLLTSINGVSAESPVVKSGRASVQLVSSHDVVAPGQDLYLALSFRLEPHWHTYWRNAGGPGNPVQIHWQLPQGAKVGEFIWPLPKIVHTGPIINYAFEDKLVLPMPFHVPETAKPGDVFDINAEALYLVCYQVCLPEMAELSLRLHVGTPQIDRRWQANIEREIKNAPKFTDGINAKAAMQNNQLNVVFEGDVLNAKSIRKPYFFPYVQDLIDSDQKQISKFGQNQLSMQIAPGFLLKDGLKDDVVGVLAYDVETESGWQRQGVIARAKPVAALPPISAAPQNFKGPISGILTAFFAAFFGGIVLNLMPCVFPVLSMKALGFAKTAHAHPNIVRRHGNLYALGVVISFLVLSALLVGLKAMGSGLGWGFQLQNPILVAALSLLFLLIALNLFGMFEIGGRWQNAGENLSRGESAKSSFFTGVLAVLVASPCSAPFMAGALGFAFTQSPPITLFIFLGLAIGFALPVFVLAHAPRLLRRLPKPGPWMHTFKQALAFPMLLTSLWLLWVLSALAGSDGVGLTGLAFICVVFAIWVFKYKGALPKSLAVLALAFGMGLLANLGTLSTRAMATESISETQWSPQAVREAQNAGQYVFVDFTADWCVSCKVNEKLFLERKSTKKLFEKHNIKKLVADWTRKDAQIAAELARHGRSGVPLYLLYAPNGENDTPLVLPQTLSAKTIEKSILKLKSQ